MSKYNRIVSIPVESIPKEEIKEAIHEWAEGDDAMERLLWACYEKGIKTGGCHAGAKPYIDFKYQENLNKLIPLFEVTQKVVGSQIFIVVDGGNPFSGPDWNLASIGIGIDAEYKDETDVYFDNLTNALEKESSNTHPLLDLLEFFIDKESGLLFRLRHNEDKFIFYVESRQTSKERYNYYSKLFTKSGLIECERKFDDGRHYWKVEDNNIESLLNKIEKIKEYIINNYSLEPEKDEEKIVNWILKARFKKKTLTEEEFDNWLKEEEKRLF